MSGSLSKKRSIALSYGNFVYPPPLELLPAAHALSLKIITRLWDDWGKDEDTEGLSNFVMEHMDQEKDRLRVLEQTRGLRDGEVDLYAINIPIVPALLREGGMKVVWARLWRNVYGRLFMRGDKDPKGQTSAEVSQVETRVAKGDELVFSFSPDWTGLLNPTKDALPYGTDAWGIHNDLATVTPLKASFGEPGVGSMGFGSEHLENLNSRWVRGGRIWDSK
jgi:tubulin--tyrosine ligase